MPSAANLTFLLIY